MAKAEQKGSRSTEERTRRRFLRRRWGRRWLTLRYVLVGLAAVAVVALGIYAVYFSPWLRADGVKVVGLNQLQEGQVLKHAEVPLGGPLAREDLHAIQLRVEALAIVKSADVSRSWPHDVRIQITERTPVAVMARGKQFVQVDATGVSFFPYLKKPPAGLPTIVTGPKADADALSEGAKVAASLPSSISGKVAHIDVSTIDRIELSLRGGRTVMWGSAEESEAKAKVLLALLKTHAHTIDVSVPGLPTTR
ncbi:MAG: FtsQ-type POTRA domain-containing protein [Nocardioidaceae bacterium]|nr:FtsQ-type POTRA domain-containing protein [Nocardioidaceae bacterium]MCL2614939.1 FtsQ-type POTRA domain-containing protein [Nocardioidaceae bacterium]